jgi:hypothetical protein
MVKVIDLETVRQGGAPPPPERRLLDRQIVAFWSLYLILQGK